MVGKQGCKGITLNDPAFQSVKLDHLHVKPNILDS